MPDLDPLTRSLLEAVSFATRAHHGQTRKDGRTPYVSHVYRVALITRHVFGIDDPAVLTAAVLHDTIEDTTTDFDDVARHFGVQIAGWVALLSKDKRQQEVPREETYRAGLAAAPWQVKVCKLADICDNLIDSKHLTPDNAPHRRPIARLFASAERPRLAARGTARFRSGGTIAGGDGTRGMRGGNAEPIDQPRARARGRFPSLALGAGQSQRGSGATIASSPTNSFKLKRV